MQGPTVPRRKALFKMLLLYLICRSKEKGIPLSGKQSPAAAEWQEEGTPGRSCYYFRGRSLFSQAKWYGNTTGQLQNSKSY